MKHLSLVVLSVIVLVAGCRKDKEIITQTVLHDTSPEVLVNTSVSGVVLDEDRSPLEDALVSLGQHKTYTDDNGFFYLKDILANQNGAPVHVELSGYHSTSQLVFPVLNGVVFTEIILLESDESGLVSAENGGTVQLSSGASVTLPANGVTYNGIPYKGDVVVHATFIDPLDEDLFSKMPGTLLGVDADGKVVGMETFGMMGVELFSPDGKPLQVAEDKKAKLSFPLAEDLQGYAPQEVKLWHFDESFAYWIEEGMAYLEDGAYIAEVGHFSFWNCDDPFPTVILEGRIINQGGNPVGGAIVRLKRNAPTNNTGYGVTSPDGVYRGKIPANERLVMEVSDPCDNLISSESIGPFTTDVTLADVVIRGTNDIQLSGRIINCQGAAVSNGYVKITRDVRVIGYATPDAAGNFNVSLTVCDQGDLTLTAYDLENQESSDEIVVSYQASIHTGDLTACGNKIPYFTIDVDGVEYTIGEAFAFTYKDSSHMPAKYITSVGAEDPVGYIGLEVEGQTVGTFPVTGIEGRLGASVNMQFSNPRVNVTFTSFGDVGQFVLGTFQGVVYDNVESKDVNVEGSFRALRQ